MDQSIERLYLRHLDCDHLYRHLTEVNGKDTRGGYIEGKLELDPVLLSSYSVLGLKIYIVSDEKALARDRIHPNLLYMTRFDGKVRKRELESSTPMWKIELEIRDGVVFWWTESEAQLAGYKQMVCNLQPNPEDPSVHNILDLKDLHLTVITPLQRTTANGIKIRDALNLRRQMARFEDCEDHDWEKLVKELESYYTKTGKSELDRVCLRFTLHLVEGEDKEDPNPCSSLTSFQPITNTRSRHIGALNLIPETMISAQKTCCRVQRTIYLPSQFKLPINAKDVYPRFVVGHPEQGDYFLDDRVMQPKESDIKIFGQFWVFTTPLQADHLIQQVYNDGLNIYIEAFRPKDRAVSDKKVEFVFATHEVCQVNDGTNIVLCSNCLEHPDEIGEGETLVNSLKKLQTSGLAKPGTKRRRTRVSSSEASSSSGFVSPGRSLFSPSYTQSPESNVSEDLMKEVDDMDEDIPIDNIDPSSFGNDIDIHRLLVTISENDVESVESTNMRPSVYPDLLSSAVRQSGINGFNETEEMGNSDHHQMFSRSLLGGSLMSSAPMSRPPSSSAPRMRSSDMTTKSAPPSSPAPSSLPPSSSATTTKRMSRPLARMSAPAPSPPNSEALVKTEPAEVKTTERVSTGRSLMFPMGRPSKVCDWKREVDSATSEDDTEEEFADIRGRSVVKNDVMLSDGAKVETVEICSLKCAASIEVKLEGSDSEDDMNYENDDNTEFAVLGMDDIKEDLVEKCRPSVLQLAERFEDNIVKSEEAHEEVKEKSVQLGSSMVQDVVDETIKKKVRDSPISATTLGSHEDEEYLVMPRGTKSGSEGEEDASISTIIYNWLGDFFPALLYLLTPFMVILLAFLVQFLWTTFVPSIQLDLNEGEQTNDDLAGIVQE